MSFKDIMSFMGPIEIAFSIIGAYNLVRGAYNMYCDAEEIKNQYRRQQKEMYEYRRAQNALNTSLTESQFHRVENEFIVLNRSLIIDPHASLSLTRESHRTHTNGLR